MKLTLTPPGPAGTRELTFGDPADGGWFTWTATQHDLDVLAAFLAADKAMVTLCPAARGYHPCGLPARHDGTRHQCAACPEQWP